MILQTKLWHQLIDMSKDNRIPHATMLMGSEGFGAYQIGLSLAKMLLCPNNVHTFCDQCKSCKLVDQYSHPDLHFSFPVVKHSKFARKDTGSDQYIEEWREYLSQSDRHPSIHQWTNFMVNEATKPDMNVKECGDIIRKLSLRSHGGTAKVLLMWLPEYLGNNSNRLLKIIEEPPKDTYLIFITHRPDRLLTTILSRFQKLHCEPLSDAVIKDYLSAKYERSGAELEKIMALAEGSVTKAEDYLLGSQMLDAEVFIKWLRVAYESNPEKLFSFTNDFAKNNKTYQKNFCEFAQKALFGLIRYSTTGKFEGLDIDEHAQSGFIKLCNVLNVDKVAKISNILLDVSRNMDQNINVRIMMMAESIKVGRILRAA